MFDQTAGIPAVLRERQPDGSYVNYIREPGGELLMRSSGAGAHYYHYDELGSTRLRTNSSGTVTDTYTYDAYGSLITHNRSTGSVDQPYQYVGRLGYYTHHQSPDFPWLQLGVRFYQPDEGRFERRDDIDLGVNYYHYANGLPISYVDPDGRLAWWVACTIPCGAAIGTPIAVLAGCLSGGCLSTNTCRECFTEVMCELRMFQTGFTAACITCLIGRHPALQPKPPGTPAPPPTTPPDWEI